jgi:hypothetical protein
MAAPQLLAGHATRGIWRRTADTAKKEEALEAALQTRIESKDRISPAAEAMLRGEETELRQEWGMFILSALKVQPTPFVYREMHRDMQREWTRTSLSKKADAAAAVADIVATTYTAFRTPIALAQQKMAADMGLPVVAALKRRISTQLTVKEDVAVLHEAGLLGPEDVEEVLRNAATYKAECDSRPRSRRRERNARERVKRAGQGRERQWQQGVVWRSSSITLGWKSDPRRVERT